MSQSEVARRLGVHRQSVIRWAQQFKRSGMRGLRKAGRAGRKPKLSTAQLQQIERALQRGPEALGYSSGLWTAGRVRELIESECGVRYHEAHVWRILRKLNWSCQRPTGRALERDEEAIRRWKKVRGHELKKSLLGEAHHHLHRRKRIERTTPSGAYLGPTRTDPGAAISFQLEGAGGSRRNYLVELLLPVLPRHYPCCPSNRLPSPSAAPPPGKLLMVWDGLPAHRARLVSEFIAAQRGRLAIEWLPAYAPELNPVEYICGLLQTSRIAQLLSARILPSSVSGPSCTMPHASSPYAGTKFLATGRTASVAILCKPQ